MRGTVGRWHSGVAAAALALLVAAPALAQTTPASPPLKWAPFIDLDGKAGTQRNIGEGDLFVPLLQNSQSMLFADLRGKFDDRSDDEGNFGFGLRHMLPSGWNLGAYGYYDRRKTALGSTFEQATFGAEALSLDWDVRANYYQPIGPTVRNISTTTTASSSSTATSTTTSSAATLAGTTVNVTTSFLTTSTITASTTAQTTQERAQGGFDGEIGWRVPVFAPDALTQLRVYAGGYRFSGNGVGPTEGPRGRLDLTIDQVPYLWNGARLDLGGEIQHDTPRGTQAFAEIRLRIPLQVFGEEPAALTAIERRMEDPIERDVDVVSQSHSSTSTATSTSSSSTSATVVETATQTTSGGAFTVLNSASTTGAALPGAVAALANNSTAVLSGTFNVTATVDLSGSKSLMAGSITVQTPSGRTAVLNTPATISSANLLRTIQAPGNNTISGLTIVTTDNGGGVLQLALNSTGANYTITNNTFTVTETGANGISAISTDRNPNLVISGNTFTLTGGTTATAVGLFVVAAPVTTATISGNTFNVSGATNNFLVNTSSAVINAGSTGNVRIAGTCTGAAASGFVGFTDGTTCH